jgi:hypothetical protein
MIFHLSIAAAQPRRVANVLAAIWEGELLPFPPVATGSFAVMAGDERNSLIEVYPLGTELAPADGDADAVELWLENMVMIEVLTDDMAAEYLATMTVAGWRSALAAGAPI